MLDLCMARLGNPANVRGVVTPGSALPEVADRSVNVVWSFDAFVHIAPTDQDRYLSEIARVLRPGGVAVIHHADGRNQGVAPSRQGWRAPMSVDLFSALAKSHGLRSERVIRDWSAGQHRLDAYADAISVTPGLSHSRVISSCVRAGIGTRSMLLCSSGGNENSADRFRRRTSSDCRPCGT